jgi:hypothetical protein
MVGISLYLLPSSRRSRSRGRRVIMGYTALMLVTTTAWSVPCFLSSYVHSLLPFRFVTAAIYAAWTLSEALASKTAAINVTNFCSPINIVANLLRTLQVLQSDALVGSNFLIHTPEREAHVSLTAIGVARVHCLQRPVGVDGASAIALPWEFRCVLLSRCLEVMAECLSSIRRDAEFRLRRRSIFWSFPDIRRRYVPGVLCHNHGGQRGGDGLFELYAIVGDMGAQSSTQIMICSKLLLHRHRLRQFTTGLPRATRISTDAFLSIVSIIAESGLAFTACCVVLVVLQWGLQSQATYWWRNIFQVSVVICRPLQFYNFADALDSWVVLVPGRRHSPCCTGYSNRVNVQCGDGSGASHVVRISRRCGARKHLHRSGNQLRLLARGPIQTCDACTSCVPMVCIALDPSREVINRLPDLRHS